jgi:prepilin-type N-terminal cleavage/methylation domain-containing protein
MKKQTGFTLIELAIVLVIIGLLLGGVLRGQELINAARVKSLITELKNTQVYIYGYQDRFRAVPGDDQQAGNHVGGTPATAAGHVQNAVIQGAWNSADITEESYLFWQHVRLAGLATGSTTVGDATYPPLNSSGGRIGVQSVNGFAIVNPTVLQGAYVVCSAGMLGRFAEQIDITLDDGITSTGSVRAFPDAGAAWDADITPAEENANYTVCMAF